MKLCCFELLLQPLHIGVDTVGNSLIELLVFSLNPILLGRVSGRVGHFFSKIMIFSVNPPFFENGWQRVGDYLNEILVFVC